MGLGSEGQRKVVPNAGTRSILLNLMVPTKNYRLKHLPCVGLDPGTTIEGSIDYERVRR